ncbi:DUF4132 domain-containing protein [Catenovulum sp. SM1970]|uniref:DUF4132 domain-containing protein n=1 Tax=Marinifaba aquimaris TaxID=2741323 RepID=UPI0015717583|nr:DUF4132 domain-containing protein [Marinifaba aquimaris]NTS76226.1 DUF4132 domain-containing protein [Marinifaba aquimaris]
MLDTDSKSELKMCFHDEFEEIHHFIKANYNSLYALQTLSLDECIPYIKLQNASAEIKLTVLISLIKRINDYDIGVITDTSSPKVRAYVVDIHLLNLWLEMGVDFPESYDFYCLFSLLYEQKAGSIRLYERPFCHLVNHIEKYAKTYGLTHSFVDSLNKILTHELVEPFIHEAKGEVIAGQNIAQCVRQLNLIQHQFDTKTASSTAPYQFSNGRFGKFAKQTFEQIPQNKQSQWSELFHHLANNSSAKPSALFLSKANDLMDEVGISPYKKLVNQWLNFLIDLDTTLVEVINFGGQEITHEKNEYIEEESHTLIKGLLWSMSRFHDQQSVINIAQLTEKCFQKVPVRGVAAAAIGNAGLYTLAQFKGLVGIGHLSRLKHKVKQSSTQKLIQKYIDQHAEKLGFKPAQIEEISAPDFDLVDGRLTTTFDDYCFYAQITSTNQVDQVWLKPDGSKQKAVPQFVKSSDAHSNHLKLIKAKIKQIKQSFSAQRERIDRIYTEDMQWNIASFEQFYLNHGLISVIARKLIWLFDDVALIFVAGGWQDVNGKTATIEPNAVVKLWHPIFAEPNDVILWRKRLEALKIKQPFKQAHREVYLLTDTERNTGSYSNRMAAHIIKQQQFKSLAVSRRWNYQLMGAFDDGVRSQIAEKFIATHNITAQFYINALTDGNVEHDEIRVWHCVTTDQIRFNDLSGKTIEIKDISPIVFSEIMRDADLFIGVTSIANDPQWQDGRVNNSNNLHSYWKYHSFGDLTEIAKTRKQVLAQLLSRLKIRDVAHIEGNFLIVQGKKQSYKIHIGSGYILIMPNDKYLCIVPTHRNTAKLDSTFLPFEGDVGLSVLLSKAFLLANDDKIDDPTILSQL